MDTSNQWDLREFVPTNLILGYKVNIDAIIFDMDGVLIDATEWHYLAFNSALSLFGFSISTEDHRSIFNGLPTSKKLEILSDKSDLPENLHGVINKLKQKFTMEIINNECRPIFQHEYLLSKLKNNGYKIVLESNYIISTIEAMLKNAALFDYFDVIVSNEDVVNPKPSPDPYLEACKILKVAPSQALVVEDNIHGVISAQKAGCHVMKVSSPSDVTWLGIKSHLESLK